MINRNTKAYDIIRNPKGSSVLTRELIINYAAEETKCLDPPLKYQRNGYTHEVRVLYPDGEVYIPFTEELKPPPRLSTIGNKA